MRPQKVVLPINLSRGYEAILEENGGALEASRTGFGNVAIKAAEVWADVAGLADGHYVFPDFLPAPDCFVTLARALELFREGRETPQSKPLSVVHAQFGETFGAVERRRLDCPWGIKGRVMRGLAERFGADADAILTDGVKLNLEGGSWVLMLPDHDNPLFYVYAEGSVEANGPAKSATMSSDGGSFPDHSDRSEALVSEYAQLVEEIIKSE